MKNKPLLALLLLLACLSSAWANNEADVVMDNNYRLRGEILSYGKKGLVLKHPSIRQNTIIMPSAIRALYFTNTTSPDIRVKDKIFLSSGTKDIISCTIKTVTADKVHYLDMFGTTRTIPRNQVLGFRLNTTQEQGFWQEPLIFDNSWLVSNESIQNPHRNQGQSLLSALKPKVQGDKYVYKLSNSNYQTWMPLYKNLGLDPSSFIFRIKLTMDGTDERGGLVFCFGGQENTVFRSNSGSGINRLMLRISPERCTLLREQNNGISILGDISVPKTLMMEGMEIKLTSSRNHKGEQIYELLAGDMPPRLIKDTAPPLVGNAFGLQMEGHLNLSITKLMLSSIVLSSKALTTRGTSTDIVLTKEEDAIPCSINGYNDKDKQLSLTTDKEYPGIPRYITIPVKYLDTVFFSEPKNQASSEETAKNNVLLKDGSRLHGDIRNMDSSKLVLQHAQLGLISLPLKNIIRIEFVDASQPARSKP